MASQRDYFDTLKNFSQLSLAKVSNDINLPIDLSSDVEEQIINLSENKIPNNFDITDLGSILIGLDAVRANNNSYKILADMIFKNKDYIESFYSFKDELKNNYEEDESIGI